MIERRELAPSPLPLRSSDGIMLRYGHREVAYMASGFACIVTRLIRISCSGRSWAAVGTFSCRSHPGTVAWASAGITNELLR